MPWNALVFATLWMQRLGFSDVSAGAIAALFAAAVASGADWKDAAMLANAAAGVVVGKIGTATVTPAELSAYVAHES